MSSIKSPLSRCGFYAYFTLFKIFSTEICRFTLKFLGVVFSCRRTHLFDNFSVEQVYCKVPAIGFGFKILAFSY